MLNKTKNVSKTDFELLTTKFNETNTQMKVSEDRFLSQQQKHLKLNLKSSKEIPVVLLPTDFGPEVIIEPKQFEE